MPVSRALSFSYGWEKNATGCIKKNKSEKRTKAESKALRVEPDDIIWFQQPLSGATQPQARDGQPAGAPSAPALPTVTL